MLKLSSPSRPSMREFLEEFASALEAGMAPTAPTAPADAVFFPRTFPGPQSDAYTSPADELFYGGAGGGGKTFLALILALTAHTNSIIFRREFSQFRGPEGLIEESRRMIGEHGRLNENLFVWRDLPGGRSIEFGAMKDADDWMKYKGRAHDLKAFDELPEFLESQYRAILAWLRTTIPGQRTRVVATGNPPTSAEGEWVIRYWGPWLDKHHPHPAVPGELRWYATVDGKDVERPNGEPFEHAGERIKPRSRTFIPAKVEDNPKLMATGYDQVLNSLPEPLRSQMRFGDFQATQVDDPWQMIPTAWVREAQRRWKAGARPAVPLTAVGCDPSRGGPDKFVQAPRYGHWIEPLLVEEGRAAPDGLAGANLIVKAVHRAGVPVLIDVIGSAGSSVYDQARSMKIRAVAMNGAAASRARDKSGKVGFVNKRAEWHWRMRELLDPTSGQDVALPPDTELLADLCAPRWKMTPRGVQVEAKIDIKKRIGRSPDKGEAVIYAFADEGDPNPPGVMDASGPTGYRSPDSGAGRHADDDDEDQGEERPWPKTL
jgi:hypothetical protein